MTTLEAATLIFRFVTGIDLKSTDPEEKRVNLLQHLTVEADNYVKAVLKRDITMLEMTKERAEEEDRKSEEEERREESKEGREKGEVEKEKEKESEGQEGEKGKKNPALQKAQQAMEIAHSDPLEVINSVV